MSVKTIFILLFSLSIFLFGMSYSNPWYASIIWLTYRIEIGECHEIHHILNKPGDNLEIRNQYLKPGIAP
jgi:hypothetical protein